MQLWHVNPHSRVLGNLEHFLTLSLYMLLAISFTTLSALLSISTEVKDRTLLSVSVNSSSRQSHFISSKDVECRYFHGMFFINFLFME